MAINNLFCFLGEQRYFPTLLFLYYVNADCNERCSYCSVSMWGEKRTSAMYLLEALLISGVFFLCAA